VLLLCVLRVAVCAPKARPPLPENRGATLSAPTRARREKLRGEFCAFIAPQLLGPLVLDPDGLNEELLRFGRHLYGTLRSKNDYAETILAIVDVRRALRRLMTPAWDLMVQWNILEPPEHRLAMPPVVLMAFLTVSLAWGWPVFAALIALGWTAFLRPGEFLQAVHGDLHLPGDLMLTELQAWLRIRQPKTRHLNARVQLARCDEGPVVELLQAVVGDLQPSAQLWPLSASAFRRRWDAVAAALRISSTTGAGMTPGSLRGGGATQFFVLTEDLVRLQLRARWRRLETLQICAGSISG